MTPACLTTAQLTEALLDAYAEQIRVFASASDGPVDADQAYAVQALVWRHLVGEARPHAWKVAASDTQSEPVAAPIFPARISASPGRLWRRGPCKVGIEAEVAVRFGQDLPARPEPYTRAEILAAIGGLHVAMEVVHFRLQDADYAGPYWRLADNLLNGALILGDEIPGWRDRDWRGLKVTVMAGGSVLDERLANPPLDDLFHCLPWWVRHVGGARAGDVVTTGAWTGAHLIGEAREVGVTISGLGQCRASSLVGGGDR